MAFIERKDPVVLNIKLTSKGRELLSQGLLDFNSFALGDSEIDYEFNAEVNAEDSEYTAFDSKILRPADSNPKIISFITRNVSGDSLNELGTVPNEEYRVENQIESIGFFTDGGTTFITDSNHVKQPDAMIEVIDVWGGNQVLLEKAPTYGTSGAEPAVGDILFVRWTYDTNTISSTYAVDATHPTPNLFYRITGVTGSLGGAGATVSVDRTLPDFELSGVASNVYAAAMIYYNEINFSGDTILNMSPTDYLSESVLNFLENSQCPTVVFPYWNMSVIFTEEIAGVQAYNLKYTQFKNRNLGGFVSYIQNQAPEVKKLGVIHYSNSSPSNIYGEGFLQDTPTLDIPTIMWHKSTTQTLGTTLSAIGGQQLLTGLDIYYYDLADEQSFVVGKMFPDLKIFVIEDQELLFAMSYKSNRSWTLPDYTATAGDIPPPEGATVTWTLPTIIENYPGQIGVTITCVEYCHTASGGWQELNGSLSVVGAVNAGYQVQVQNTAYGSCTKLCAYDFVAGNCSPGYTEDDQDSFSSYYTTIYNANPTGTNPYYFTGHVARWN